jgi:serine/threonine protein kinase
MPLEKIGRYEIKSELGRGGMAAVYLAFDPSFKREVAVKILPPQLLADPVYRARFEREAQTIAALEHPAIVPVYDFGEEEGQLYLVMRYMPGGSLADKLKNGTLPPSEIVHIIARITSALDQVHSHGIIHRDLKPGNILFDQYGEAYLSDFGIARLSEVSTTLTGTAIVGTPAYMSPEQARGDSDIDGRTDLYAVGAILYQMLSGKLPYESTTPLGLAMKHITDPVPSLVQVRPDLPPTYDRVIETAMAKDPSDRYQTGQALAIDLEAVAEGHDLPSRPSSPQYASAPVSPAIAPQNPFPPASPAVVLPNQSLPASLAVALPNQSLPVQPAARQRPVFARIPRPRVRIPWLVLVGGGLVLLVGCVAAVVGIGMAAGLWGKSQPAEPTSQAKPLESSLPYLDEFNNPASGWPVYSGDNGQSGYEDDGYHILVAVPYQQITARPGKQFIDTVIEFEATQLEGPQDAYFGALCRYQDARNYYYLIIGTDGYYSIGKILAGENVPLSTTDSSEAILPEQAENSIRAECTSDILALFANGELLAQVEDADFVSGDVGLLAGTLDTAGADIRFTNFYVTQP